jgi:hypothetical protein
MKIMQFEPGDVVYLKSGSVKMTVVSASYATGGTLGESCVTVMWMVYDIKDIRTQSVPHSALILADRRPSRRYDKIEY